MDYITPKDNYLIVFPDGEAVTFFDVEGCYAYRNRYYEERIKLNSEKNIYANYDMYEEKAREDIARVIGAEEGEAKIYDLDSVIEEIQKSGAFDDEKEEIISKLMGENSKIQISDYGLDNVLLEARSTIW
ncbi:hypothetical protein [Clostridium sp.]|uniref:hypothetical protein n=1 Tax=Clostridium sp. TaxID=1506 RepID=UPI002FCB977D